MSYLVIESQTAGTIGYDSSHMCMYMIIYTPVIIADLQIYTAGKNVLIPFGPLPRFNPAMWIDLRKCFEAAGLIDGDMESFRPFIGWRVQ